MSRRPDSGHEVRTARVRTADGIELIVHRFGSETGVPVVCVHGTFSNHTYWLGTRGSGFGRALAAAGFEAWVVDLRGHGASPRPAADDAWDFEDWARLDLHATLRAAIARSGERGHDGVFTVGHSAGGAALLMALAAEPDVRRGVLGLVTAGTPLPWTQGFRGAGARAIRFASGLLGRFPARLLGLGPEDELPHVMRQWMTWNLNGEMIGRDGTDYAARLPMLRMPYLSLAGAGDALFAPPHACRALFERMGSADRTFVVCGTEHGFERDFGHPDLIASRAARDAVWPLIVDWLRVRRAGEASEDGAAADAAAHTAANIEESGDPNAS